MQQPGVVAFISAKDIPGENAIRTGPADSLLFAHTPICIRLYVPNRNGEPLPYVEYVGQPLGIIVAQTASAACNAASRVEVEYYRHEVNSGLVLADGHAVQLKSLRHLGVRWACCTSEMCTDQIPIGAEEGGRRGGVRKGAEEEEKVQRGRNG